MYITLLSYKKIIEKEIKFYELMLVVIGKKPVKAIKILYLADFLKKIKIEYWLAKFLGI